ncbi:DUF6560 family protein [Massilioclostridium coli]|uniref:DUF6560 family protein n=1 Tax=Massilioclostridium coli TaxID=1870991 RepID=UPI00114D0CA0|nr:DUF6560 family protein [Massilioclostridium coli]
MVPINIGIILFIIFLPVCLPLAFLSTHKSENKPGKAISDDNFTVSIPSTVIIIGILCNITSCAVLLGFTFFSKELPHFIFYCIFGLFFWLGIYLILKTLAWKVVIKGEKITVFSFFKKPYSFTFSEISSVVRQVKQNQVNSERIVIKTITGKKLIVENMEISYNRFAKKIQMQVKKEKLIGF